MTENQKLREALQAISHIDDTTNHTVDASAALDRIGQIARQALALPTEPAHADTWGISRAMVTLYAYECDGLTAEALALPTATPVGDLADLPRYTAWSHLKTHGSWPEGIDRSWMKDEMGRYNDVTVSNAVIAELRAALSAGDAVDAQRYRWLMDNCTLGIKQNGVGWILNTSACVAPDCIKDVGAAIDAAMRKGQL